MMCPVCKKAMVVVEHQQIELDYCTQCRGVWFDSDELELLLESVKLESPELTIGSILGLPELPSSTRRRKCPICRRGMKEVAIGAPAINIDVCRRGDGLWFDGGELQALLQQLASQPAQEAGKERRVLAFLGEVFQVPG